MSIHLNFHIPVGAFWLLGGIVVGAVIVGIAYRIAVQRAMMRIW